MAISNVNTTNPLAPTKPVAPAAGDAQGNRTLAREDRQPAAIVTLSAQAKKMSLEQAPRAQAEMRSSQAEPAPRAQTESRASQIEQALRMPVEPRASRVDQAPRTQAATRSNQMQAAVQADKISARATENSARGAAEAPVLQQQETQTEDRPRVRINTYA